MAVYVMGDIHGAYKAFVQCLERSGFDNEKDTLIQLGDVTDRHPDVYECVEALLQIRHLVAIKGNHDDWFMQYINTGLHPGAWSQGGKSTLASYLQHSGGDHSFLNPGHIPGTHAAFFNSQRHYYVSEDNDCFLHAGFDRTRDFYEQDHMLYYWDRNLWQQAMAIEAYNRDNPRPAGFAMKTTFRNIYIGHTPTTRQGTDQPVKAMNIYNLDTGAGHTGRLTIMDIATGQCWQSDKVSTLYAHS